MNKINKENPFTQDDVDNFNDSGIKVERNNNGKIEIVEIKKPNDLLRIRNEFNKYRNEFNKNTEPQTKRWENVKPKAIINKINWTDINEPIKKEDIFYKGGEPIKEPYEPKVGDRFTNKIGIIWEITNIEKLYFTLINYIKGDVSKDDIDRDEMMLWISNGTLKKIN